MKKSELKEIIKSAMLEESSEFDTNKPSRIESFLRELDDLIEEYHAELYLNDDWAVAIANVKSAAKSEMGNVEIPEIPGFEGTRDTLNSLGLEEAEEVDVEDNEEVDVDIEKDVEVDDESVETDIDVKGSMPGENTDEIAVQSLLMKAQEEAEKLGDEKLTDQIGNTITYFTRAHVATVDEGEEIDEIAAEPGADGVEDVNMDNPAEDAMVGLTESLRWKRIAGIAKDNGIYDNLK